MNEPKTNRHSHETPLHFRRRQAIAECEAIRQGAANTNIIHGWQVLTDRLVRECGFTDREHANRVVSTYGVLREMRENEEQY